MDWAKARISKPGLIGPGRWNWVLEQCRSAFVESVVGGTWTRGPGGTALFVASGGAAPPTHPFKLLKASVGGVKKIRVIYGTLAGEMPSGFSVGDDPPYLLTVTATGLVYAILTIDGATGVVNSRTLGNGASLPADDDTTFHLELGSYAIDGDLVTIAQAVSGSLAFVACRNWYADPATFTGNWGNV